MDITISIDESSIKSGKTILYIPGISFQVEDIAWLSNKFINSGYNFISFEFPYNENKDALGDYSIDEDIEFIKNVLLQAEQKGIPVNNLGMIGKSFGCAKLFLSDINIQCAAFIAPVVYYNDGANIDTIRTRKYKDIASLEDIVLKNDILLNRQVSSIFIHGSEDEVVNYKNSQYMFELLQSKKQIQKIDGMGHSINSLEDKNKVADYIIEFFQENF